MYNPGKKTRQHQVQMSERRQKENKIIKKQKQKQKQNKTLAKLKQKIQTTKNKRSARTLP